MWVNKIVLLEHVTFIIYGPQTVLQEDVKIQLDEERDRNAELEEELQQLRKQLELDSKPEAEQNGETDSWNDSDEELFASPGRQNVLIYSRTVQPI